MTPREYLDLFRERWRAILAGLLLGIAVAVGIVVTATPLYAAQVTLFVSAGTSADASAALDRSQLSSQRMQTYVKLIMSDRVAGDVVQSLALPMTGPELAGRIAASSEPETVLLDAIVSDEDPVRAATIANTLAEQFISAVEDLEQPGGVIPGDAVVSASVFEDAVPPAEPDWPRPVLTIAIGALLGLLAGFALAVLRRALGTSITSRRLLGDAVAAPVLGVVARQRGSAKHPLVVRDAPRGPRAEAYRQLRTNLQFVDVDRALKVVMLTSPSPGDGTTTVLANLAVTMAEAGQRVLVVEADLRRPRAADVFGVEQSDGLSSVLARRAEVDDVVQHGEGGVDILPSGPIPPNPGQLLASPRMAELLDELRPRYDVILLDTSPLLPVADATVLAPLADGVVLVVRAGTPAHRVEAAREALGAVSARLVGTVLVGVRSRAARGDQRYAAATPAALPTPAAPPAPETPPALPAAPEPAHSDDTATNGSANEWRPSPVPRTPVPEERGRA
jgi:capsular exopolysaccharide synthesis family protein